MTNESDVQELNQARHLYADAAFPELKREDFVDDNEYKVALANQYQAMREYEFDLACRRETLDMYNVSKDLESQGVPSDSWVWSGTSVGRSVTSAGPDSYVLNGEVVPGVDGQSGDPSCAAAACRVNNNIGDRFGVNLRDEYVGGYNSISMHDGTPFRESGEGKEFLYEMIEQGNIDAGTMITRTRQNGSGHAYTVAGVIRDEDGKITNIALQANNGNSCRVYSVDDFVDTLYNEARSSGANFYVTGMKKFANSAVVAELDSSQQSPEELQALISQTRGRIDDNIEALQQIEQTTLTFNSSYASFMQLENGMYNDMIAALPAVRPDEVLGRAEPVSSHQYTTTSSNPYEPDFVRLADGRMVPFAEMYYDDDNMPYLLSTNGERIDVDVLDGVVVVPEGVNIVSDREKDEELKADLRRQEQGAYAEHRVQISIENPNDARFDEAARKRAEDERKKKGKGKFVDRSQLQQGNGTCSR